MRKKILSLAIMLVLLTFFSIIKVYADEPILGETIVNKYTHYYDLPTQYVKGSNIKMYEYDGEEVYDFRDYFEILDNAQTILNMHGKEGPVDLGGYVWETNFDINVVGYYQVSLSYQGVTGLKTNFVDLQVIETDIEAPQIYMDSTRNFHINRKENTQAFDAEFQKFINEGLRVYDKVDGLIVITKDYFSEQDIENLKDAHLKDKITITLTVVDKAGNSSSETVIFDVIDSEAPNIQNIKTIVTKKGKRINYTSHLRFSDNYSDYDEIERNYKIYKNLTKINVWETGDKRSNQSLGKALGVYVKLAETGIDSFIDHLKLNFGSVYSVGDYFEVVDGQTVYYVVIASKTEGVNNWEALTSKNLATGVNRGKYTTIEKTKEELFEHTKEELKTGHSQHDYYQVLDITLKSTYYIYVKEKQDLLENEILTINFNKTGVQYVRVEAKDEYGNTSVATFRVVIEDGLSLFQTVLIINATLLAVVAASVGVYLILKRRQH